MIILQCHGSWGYYKIIRSSLCRIGNVVCKVKVINLWWIIRWSVTVQDITLIRKRSNGQNASNMDSVWSSSTKSTGSYMAHWCNFFLYSNLFCALKIIYTSFCFSWKYSITARNINSNSQQTISDWFAQFHSGAIKLTIDQGVRPDANVVNDELKVRV